MFRIAVAGNPNSGKTCIFNNLTGSTQHVGNYPGVTVELSEGMSTFGKERVQIIDLPGTYSLTAYSQEEIVARDFVIRNKPEVIINVVDASNLERNLYLTIQLLELNVPIVVALNMIDVAEKRGHTIDAAKLGKLFGIKVVPTIGNKGRGMDALKQACLDTIREKILPKPLAYSHELQGALQPLSDVLIKNPGFLGDCQPGWLALKLLEDDEEVVNRLNAYPENDKIKKVLAESHKHIEFHSGEEAVTAVVEARYAIAAGAVLASVSKTEQAKRLLTDKIDAIVCNRFLGPLVLLGVVYLLFLFVFKLADEVEWIPLFNGQWVSPVGLFEKFFESLSFLAQTHIHNKMLLSLVDDGLIGGVGGVLGFVPLIFFMFFFISILEDTGYIARVAFILDRLLRAFGLQGKSILAMIVSGGLGGGGCAVPGVMATRTLREEKDRLVTILVAPLMNCGAKMPVYAMLIAAFFAHTRGAMMFLLWLLSWVFALCAAFCLRKWVVKGEQTPFVMELPVYHVPTWQGVLLHTWTRTWLYIKKAGTIILAISVVLWALMYFPKIDAKPFETKRANNAAEFRADIAVTAFSPIFADDKQREDTAKFLSDYREASEMEEPEASEAVMKRLRQADPLRYEFATQLMQAGNKSKQVSPAAKTYQGFLEKKAFIDAEEKRQRLLNSFAGKAGEALTPISKLAGFGWKENIALIGGFAAKEVVVGTMGTAYAMGEVDPEESESLSERLSEDPDWNPLRAFVLMVFVMIYAPCFVTVIAIKRETGSWKWAFFSTAYSTFFGFIIAVVIYQVGGLFFS